MYTKDPQLGDEIRKVLHEAKCETPKIECHTTTCFDFASPFKTMMEGLGLNLENDSLCDTPKRIDKMFNRELFYGLNYDLFPKCTAVENEFHTSDMQVMRDISIKSVCEHHFLPIYGTAKVAYLPNQKVLGLSKFNRVCDFFSRRPQVQERLTQQIYHALKHILGTENIAVQIQAQHFCSIMRGIEHEGTVTITNKYGGAFYNNDSTRNEFLIS